MPFQRLFFVEKPRNPVFVESLFEGKGIGSRVGNEHRDVPIAKIRRFRHEFFDIRRDIFRFGALVLRLENTDFIRPHAFAR